MRRGLASLILGWALILASFTWAGFVLERTVLDPGRSERLAEQLLDNEVLREALVSRLASAMESSLPAETPLPRQTLEAAADGALEDPAVERLVIDGLVCTHQNALNGVAEGCTIEASALAQGMRSSLVATNPELDATIPAVPVLAITLPDTGLSWLGGLRSFVVQAVRWGALAAGAGAVLALVLTSDRPGVLRRVAWWAFGAAAFWLVVAFVLPWLVGLVAPTGAAVAAALIDVFFGAMIPPAIVMALVGAALFGGSILWGSAGRRLDVRRALPEPGATRSGPIASSVYVPPADVGHPGPAERFPGANRGGRRSTMQAPHRKVTPGPPAASPPPRPAASGDPTTAFPRPAAEEQRPTMIPRTPRHEEAPRWVEGVGYVDEEPGEQA